MGAARTFVVLDPLRAVLRRQVVGDLVVHRVAAVVVVLVPVHARLGGAGARRHHPALGEDLHEPLRAQRLAVAFGATEDQQQRLLVELLEAVRDQLLHVAPVAPVNCERGKGG